MRRRKSIARWALLLPTFALLAGCASQPQSIGEQVDVIPTEAVREASNPDNLLDGPFAFVDGGELHVTLAGSSSCPPVPVSAEPGEDRTFVIGVEQSGGTVCTADLAQITYRLDVSPIPDRVAFAFGPESDAEEIIVWVAKND